MYIDAAQDVPAHGPVLSWPVRRLGGESDSAISYVAMEEPLSVEINGHQVAVLMRLPGHEKELAVGFCVSEGLISDFQSVEIVHHCGQGVPLPGVEAADGEESRNRIQIRARPDAVTEDANLEVTRLIRSGCGAVGTAELQQIDLSPVVSDLKVSVERLLRLNRVLREGQETHRLVGGVHGTALFDAQGTLIVVREDIGRHNAVDKVIGHCLMRGIPLRDKLLVATGRASYEMVTKAVRLGIPIVATISACTSLAVQLAAEYHVTLIGYLRGKRLTVYTHPQRIAEDT